MKKTTKSTAPTPKSKAKKAPAQPKAPARRRPAAAVRRQPAARACAAKSSGADIDHLGDLPRGYDEETIFVVAQEPHWLFCYWDYRLAGDGEGALFLRHGRIGGEKPEAEVPVPAETNSWYLSVRDADADYYVELGRYNGGHWQSLTRSGAVLTPRDAPAGFGEPVFANMPFHATFQQLVEKLRGEMSEGESLAAALARLQGRGDLPLGRLSTAHRIALDRLLESELGSLTSTGLASYLGSPGASPFSGGFAPSSWGAAAASGAQAPGESAPGPAGASFEQAMGGWSSASWGAPSRWMSSWGPREFFMHLNAEVIFYGGTHPDAKATVNGEDIMVRPDGTFRYHFIFPDGTFEIPITATSPDGGETRRGVLRFERATTLQGEVGSTPQPPLGAPMGPQH